MSASSVETSETKVSSLNDISNSNTDSRYALYLFSNNKHASSSGSEHSNSERGSTSSKAEIEEQNICLSLLEGNLSAGQETDVRCYLNTTLSQKEGLSFENEGKYAVLHLSDESGDPFGCYYHRLSKVDSDEENENTPKQHTFFICLIGPANGAMESCCLELSKYCCSLITLLDPEGLKNKSDMQTKLNSWYTFCVEYIGRLIKNFQEDIPLLLLCSLWGNVEVSVENEDLKWDLERFIETCSLMADNEIISSKLMYSSDISPSTLKLVEENGKIKVLNKTLMSSPYCLKWFDKLKNSSPTDYKAMHTILEGFRLKTVQDLNTLKRLLQKSVNDHYSLYKAYLFLQNSGYYEILLHHVEREAKVSSEMSILEVIICLREFIEDDIPE